MSGFKVLVDTHTQYLNIDTASFSRHMPATLTGRIKYEKYEDHTKMYAECVVDAFKMVKGKRWWNASSGLIYRKTKWVEETSIILEEIPEEVIYGCVTTSTDNGDTRS